jgi:hypothetical protein
VFRHRFGRARDQALRKIHSYNEECLRLPPFPLMTGYLVAMRSPFYAGPLSAGVRCLSRVFWRDGNRRRGCTPPIAGFDAGNTVPHHRGMRSDFRAIFIAGAVTLVLTLAGVLTLTAQAWLICNSCCPVPPPAGPTSDWVQAAI